ncbi:O-antigen/teichoic acid export membrane protein [Kineosphaera limosa]|uniref:Polysaccharide biosynthesis protein n=1 Tax=Kineosphaera limosa NBRC 100340 TaxID=1184609 RepID=K6X1E1_9MICO|nr:hypothetical protein [Kineosphaera limosa]NYE00134.1 O-antigen/teichoic acid export membrane protein [Kineosphaera limosa]GAB98187.1 hypothetical protein KILIM_110_00020 [Kineosphaera limosa NBRC 100340]
MSWNYGAGLTSILGLVLLYPWAVALAGAAPYGLWVLAFGAAQLLVMADFGIGDGIVRQMGAMTRGGAGHLELRRFVSVALTLFIAVALALAGLYAVAVPLYLRTVPTDALTARDHHVVVVAGALALFLALMARATNAVLWAQDRQDIERKATMAGMALRVAGFAVVAANGGGLHGVVVAEVVSAAVSPVVCGTAVAARFGAPTLTRAAIGRYGGPLLRLGSVLFVGSLAALLTFQLPLFVVGSTLGLVAATAYGALMRVYQSARMINSWTANPFIHQLSSAEPHELAGRARTCFVATAVAGTAIAVVCAGLADELLVAWLGQQFAFAGPALAALAVAMVADAVVKPSALVVNLRGRPVVVSLLHLAVCVLTIGAVWMATRTGSLLGIVVAMSVVAALFAPAYVVAATRVIGASPYPLRPMVALLVVAALAYAAIRGIAAVLAPWPAVLTVAGVGVVLLGAAALVWRRRTRRADPAPVG